jgi:ferredoxin
MNAANQESTDSAGAITVTVTLDDQTIDVPQRGTLTILQLAREAGLPAPSMCELGNCGSCIARVYDGRVEMRRNGVLPPDDVDEGWILTCQAVATTPSVRVVYEL